MYEQDTSSLVIREHDFQEAKNSLKKYSAKSSSELTIPRVDVDGGLFDWGNHKVTGSELNRVTSQIQGFLIDLNKLSSGFINEFGQVYRAFESLDKDYIQGIVGAIKAAEKVSADEQKDRAEIKVIIARLDKSVDVLKKFKNDIDRLKHITDVDKAWELIAKQQTICNSLTQYKQKLSGLSHLMDVDGIWSDTSSLKGECTKLRNDSAEILRTIGNIERAIDGLRASVSRQQQERQAFEGKTNKVLSEYRTSMDGDIRDQSAAIKKHQEDVDGAIKHAYSEIDRQFGVLSRQTQQQIDDAQRAQTESLERLAKEQTATVDILSDECSDLRNTIGEIQKLVDEVEQSVDGLKTELSRQLLELQTFEAKINKDFSDHRASLEGDIRVQSAAIKKHRDDVDGAIKHAYSEIDRQFGILSGQTQQQISNAQQAQTEALEHLSEKQSTHFESLTAECNGLRDSMEGIQKLVEENGRSVDALISALSERQLEWKAFETRINKNFSDHRASLEGDIRVQSAAIKKHRDDVDGAIKHAYSEIDRQFGILSSQTHQQIDDVQKKHTEALECFSRQQTATVVAMQKQQERRLEELTSSQDEQITSISNTIETEKTSLQETVCILKHKLKTAYIIAGSAAALALINFSLNILGII